MAVLFLLLINAQPLGYKKKILPLGGSAFLSLPWGPSGGLTVGVIKPGPSQELVPTQLVSKMSGSKQWGQWRSRGRGSYYC